MLDSSPSSKESNMFLLNSVLPCRIPLTLYKVSGPLSQFGDTLKMYQIRYHNGLDNYLLLKLG